MKEERVMEIRKEAQAASSGVPTAVQLERINALGTTVIVVTHERGLVNHFNKRVIYLDSGRVVGDATGTYEGVAPQ